jgi:hypothetical protein
MLTFVNNWGTVYAPNISIGAKPGASEVGQRLKGDDVVRVLNRMKQQHGVPKVVFCDNGSEFTGQAMDLWAYQNGMKDRLLATGQADRQCRRGVVQWNLPRGVPERPLLRDTWPKQWADRGMASGIQ